MFRKRESIEVSFEEEYDGRKMGWVGFRESFECYNKKVRFYLVENGD